MTQLSSRAGRRLVAGLLALGSLAMLLTLRSDPSSSRGSRPTPPAGSVPATGHVDRPRPSTSLEHQQLASFSVLRTTPEPVPARTMRLVANVLSYRLNWAHAQRLPILARGSFWAVPANRRLCVVAQVDPHSASATCTTTARAVAHGVAYVGIAAGAALDNAAAPRLIVGIAPDRAREALVHTHGAVAATSVTGNVFVLQDSLSDPPSLITLR